MIPITNTLCTLQCFIASIINKGSKDVWKGFGVLVVSFPGCPHRRGFPALRSFSCLCKCKYTFMKRKTLKLWSKKKNMYTACGTNLYDFVSFGTKVALNKVTQLSFAYRQMCANIHGFRSNTIQNQFTESYFKVELHIQDSLWQSETEVSF